MNSSPSVRLNRKSLVCVIAAIIVGALGGSWATAKGLSPFGAIRPVPVVVATVAAGSRGAGAVSFENGFQPAVDKALPAVVNIASTKVVRSPDAGPASPFFSDPFFRQFFGDQFSQEFRAPRQQREHSLGSGVIVNSDGYVLTNYHVVEGANEIKVSLGDQREFQARIIGTDQKTDIAVVKVNQKDLPVITLGDSSKVHVGDFALAIGDPFGLSRTVTMGIISATGRGGLGIEDYEDFIQTDAAINPGNSGGALINVHGELVGINTAIITGGGGGNQGVGFAIPVNMARNVMDQIIKHGKVVRGRLGVVIQAVTPDIAKAFGLAEPHGALVSDVSPGSPAAEAGIKTGDIIVEMNGQRINDSGELQVGVSLTAPGTVVRLKVFRGGQEREVDVKLGEMTAAPGQAASAGAESGPKVGIALEDLTPQVARQLGLPANTFGAVITQVEPGSAAQEAGLERGDVIQEINHRSVANASEARRMARDAGHEALLLRVNRHGDHLFVVVTPR